MTASGAPSTLPPLSSMEEEHSRAVAQVIRDRVDAAGGWLPFETFMELALYAPGLGYYSAGGTKIGAGGDFTTAPQISDLFSTCVAHQCVDVLARTGGSILELGAGTGRMAAAVLETLASMDALPDHYAILEVSADLRDRQRERIERLPPDLRRRVVWFDTLPAQPVRGVILANEVLDALPCHRIVIRNGRVRALGVARADDDSFVEREHAVDEPFAASWERLARDLPYELPDGYRTELCVRVAPWIASLADCLERGVMLLFDYGLPRAHYYHPQRSQGTLRCHFKQLAHDDPFVNVGVQDITAWVDFTRVAEAADAAGLQVRGFATQAAFLLGLGIEGLVRDVRQASEARQLLMPGEMGEVFKAMALARDFDEPLRGFSVQDLRHSL
jgi:SAM-dependent MidA family methyltransferase